MVLASLLLAELAQPVQSPGDPQPCAVADVPGCLPGYRPLHDRFGRLVYACDPKYIRAPAETPSPPQSHAPQAQAVPRRTDSPQQALPVEPSEGRGYLAIVFMPGVSAFPSYTQLDRTSAEVQFALECLRNLGRRASAAHREYTTFGKLGELSYDFFDGLQAAPGSPRSRSGINCTVL